MYKDVAVTGFTPSHFCVFLVLLLYTSAFFISYNLLIPLKKNKFSRKQIVKKKKKMKKKEEGE